MAYVQGARPPGHPAARHLASQLFARGHHCTSAYRCSGTYHGCGPVQGGCATDWGDSVNDLRAVWLALWPHRHKLAELLGPWGLYRHGRPFRHARLQAQHRDHVHAANTQTIVLASPGPAGLRPGQHGPSVRHLQLQLRALGYRSVAATGFYGQATRRAVQLFQQKFGLKPASGSAGPRTRAAIRRRLRRIR